MHEAAAFASARFGLRLLGKFKIVGGLLLIQSFNGTTYHTQQCSMIFLIQYFQWLM